MASFSTIFLLVLSDGFTFSGKDISYEEVYKMKFGLSNGSIRVIVNRLFDRGFIQKIIKDGKAYFRLTSAGVSHINVLFFPGNGEKWDGKWRVVLDSSYGNNSFGMLQKRVYVSPFPFKGKPPPQQLFFETRQLGTFSHKQVVEEVWKLSRLIDRFEAWIVQAKSFRSSLASGWSRYEVVRTIFQYEDLMEDMPTLPRELLPSDWPEKRAQKVFIRLIQKYLVP